MSDLTALKQGIGRADIRAVIELFYDRVRQDPRLGPIFARHVGTSDADWRPHLGKIEDFWANVMMGDRAYQGNPMRIHMALGRLGAEDFARWLEIFDRAAGDSLPEKKAEAFRLAAHRIGRSLAMGLERQHAGRPPRLAG